METQGEAKQLATTPEPGALRIAMRRLPASNACPPEHFTLQMVV
jgi:hypothetical protein